MIGWFIALFSLAGTVFGVYHAIISVMGSLKKRREMPKSPPKYRIAAVIAARNEESVIAQLVESLQKQRYPRELYDIFVVPNNCTDRTEAEARAAGARILDCDEPVRSKGEVLRVAFRKLTEMGEHDAFCIFDADNLVEPDFISAANDALCAGYQVAQGYRDSKNPDDNWVAGCTSVFFWFMDRLYNDARFSLNLSAALNGTGIMISAEALRIVGWDVSTLTEDLEFTARCALNDIKIGWMRDAVIYDEQPTRLKDSFTQRRRWSAGAIQGFKRYFVPLAKRAMMRDGYAAVDIAMIFAGPFIQLTGMVPFVTTLALLCRRVIESPAEGLPQALAALIVSLSGAVVGGAAVVLAICLLEKKMSVRRIPAMLLMAVYLATWMVANLMCLVTKPPRWTSIPHGQSMQKTKRMPRKRTFEA